MSFSRLAITPLCVWLVAYVCCTDGIVQVLAQDLGKNNTYELLKQIGILPLLICPCCLAVPTEKR